MSPSRWAEVGKAHARPSAAKLRKAASAADTSSPARWARGAVAGSELESELESEGGDGKGSNGGGGGL